jgi:hypothetical protein
VSRSATLLFLLATVLGIAAGIPLGVMVAEAVL